VPISPALKWVRPPQLETAQKVYTKFAPMLYLLEYGQVNPHLLTAKLLSPADMVQVSKVPHTGTLMRGERIPAFLPFKLSG